MNAPTPPRPARVLAPVRWLPPFVPETLVAAAASHMLREALADGLLDDLEGRALAVDLREPDTTLRFTVRARSITPAPGALPTAVTVSATAEDLLRVLAQRVDPDTLFFQRRLKVSGDTALGLTVKNLLDDVDTGQLPRPLRFVVQQAAEAVPEPDEQTPQASPYGLGHPREP